jgi:hypothetical protein
MDLVKMLNIKQISLQEANGFIAKYHRHHNTVVGHKWSIGCFIGDNLVGVAICGRPVSRKLDDGNTIEVTRLCTDGTKNACSKLYGSCARITREFGYNKIITYILDNESGASLKATGWVCAKCGGMNWNVPSRQRVTTITTLFEEKIKYPLNTHKQRYTKTFNGVKKNGSNKQIAV